MNSEAPFDGLNDHWHEPPHQEMAWWWWIVVGLIGGIAFILLLSSVSARDLGQWDKIDPLVKAWFGELMQPDTIGAMGGGVSCCGESDAYWADDVHVRDGKIYAVITDDRDDGPLMRMHEEIGTEYEIPLNKIVGDKQRVGNPTGHTVIFLGTRYWLNDDRQSPRQVLCYVENSGS